MSDEIFDLNELKKLQSRVVRGAKPSTKNATSSARIQVVTDEIYDDSVPKEYLLEPSIENLIEGTAFFENNGNGVGVASSQFPVFLELEEGDLIKVETSKQTYSLASVSVDGKSVELTSAFVGSAGEQTFLGKKVHIGKASYQYTENDSSLSQFEYDQQLNQWVLLSGGSFQDAGLTSEDPVLLESGISLSWVKNSKDDEPDVQIVGSVVDKLLPTVSSDSPSVSLTPIPFPGDHSTLKVERKLPSEASFQPIEFGYDYLVNYSNSPIFQYPYPSFSQRSVASLMFVDNHRQTSTVDSSFNGQVVLQDTNGVSVANVVPSIEDRGTIIEGVSVNTVEGSNFEEGSDYIVNRSSGSVTFINNSINEEPIHAVLYDGNFLDTGLSVEKGSGTVDSPDFSQSTKLKPGVDYNLNLSNGGFLFSKDLNQGEVIRFNYLVQGTPIKEIKESGIISSGERVNDLRTDRFPIVQGTVSLVNSTKQGQVPLVEGEDFSLSYLTGVITLLRDDFESQKFIIDYVPASQLEVLIGPPEEENYPYTVKIVQDPVYVVNAERYEIKFANPSISIPDGENFRSEIKTDFISELSVPVEGAEPVPLDLTRAVYKNDTKILTLNKSTNDQVLKYGQFLLASYRYQGSSLPYAPLIVIQHVSDKGEGSFLIEGKDLSTEIGEGHIIKATSFDTQEFYFFKVKSAELVDAINTEIKIYGSFPARISDASILVSDLPVPVTDMQTTVKPFSRNNSSIVLTGDASELLQVGKIITINNSIVHSVTGYRVNEEGDTEVEISPATKQKIDSASSDVSISSKILYAEGDNGIVAESPILGTPLAPIEVDLSDYIKSTGDASAFIYIDNNKIVLTQTISGVSTEYPPIEYRTLDGITEIKNEIESIEDGLGNSIFEVNWKVSPGSDIKTQYIKTTLEEAQPQMPLPYKIKTSTQVLRKREGEADYSALEQGESFGSGDFSVNNGAILLSSSVKKGDRFLISYQGLNTLKDYRGETLDIKARYLASIPKGTQLKVSTDYIQPDQWYIQAMTQADFMNNVALPDVEQKESQRKGAPTQGVESNTSVDQGNAQGGIQDNYYLLRDEQIKLETYRQIYNYYTKRLSTFARESQSVKGFRLGNNDFYLGENDAGYSLSTNKDIDHQATFGISRMLPLGWDKSYLKKDGRFEGEYLSYGKATFLNYNSKGRAVGDNPEWSERLEPGDQIRVRGIDQWLTIESVDRDDALTFVEAIDGFKEYSNSAGFISVIDDIINFLGNNSFQYEVKKSVNPLYPNYNDRGLLGSQAIGTLGEPYGIPANSASANAFVIEYSEDEGSSWSSVEVDLTSAGPVYTAESVSKVLLENSDFKNNFKVEIEYLYTTSLGTDSTVSASWPISVLDTQEDPGYRVGIAIRSNRKEMLIRFPEPEQSGSFLFPGTSASKNASSYLGFSQGFEDSEGNQTGVWYTPYYSSTNAFDLSEAEKVQRTEQVAIVDSLLSIGNKLERSGSLYKTQWDDVTQKLEDSILLSKESVESAKEQAEVIIEEDTASSAIAVSYEQANEAITEYNDIILKIEDAEQQNKEVLFEQNGNLVYPNTSLSYENFDGFIWSFVQTIEDRNSIVSTFSGKEVTLTASGLVSDDPRVFIAEGGVADTWPVGNNNVPIFPVYVDNNTVGGFTSVIKAEWKDPSAPERAMTVSTSGPFGVEIVVSSGRLDLFYNSNVIYFDLQIYRTVADLVQAIGEQTNWEVIGGILNNNDTRSTGELTERSYSLSNFHDLDFDPLPYSLDNSYQLEMSTAFELIPDFSGQEYEITDSEIILYSGTGTDALSFSNYSDLGGLLSAIDNLTNWSTATVPTTDVLYDFGVLAPKQKVSIPSSAEIYYGIKSDIAFYQVSDKNLNELKTYVDSRNSDLQSFYEFYEKRFDQITASIGTDGEKLKDNRNLWLDRIVHKEEGPCVQIKTLKQRLESQ
jgi:hypothetical protein